MGFFKRLFDKMSSLDKTAEVLAAEYDRLPPSMSEQERLYWLSGLASNMIQSGEADNAHHALLAALDVDPDWVPALCMIGTLYHAVGEHRKALPLLERALSTQEELKRQFEQYASIVAQIGDEDLLTRFEREIHRPHDTEDMLTATRQILAECRQALEREPPRQE